MEKKSTKLVKIKDAIALVNHNVNLVGIVLERREPKRCRNNDWICTLRVVDETYSNPGLTVNVFSNTLEELPHVKKQDQDLILFTRIKMKAYGETVNAACNKHVSSFALYGSGGGSTGHGFELYQCTSNFCEEEHYKSHIDSLAKLFASGSRVDKALQSTSYRTKRHNVDKYSFLREIKEGKCFYFVCKILYANEDMSAIFVWDGTDAPPAPILVKGTEEDETFSRYLSVHTLLPRDILLSFPTSGTVLRVVISSNLFHQVKPGDWVKLWYIRCEVDRRCWVGKVTEYTKVHPAQDDPLVEKITRIYDKRKSSKFGHIPFWSFPSPPGLTETDCDSAPFVTLMDIITFRKVTYRYRCIARVIAAYEKGRHRVLLTLEDPTATIEAFLCDKEAEYFWGVEEVHEEKEMIMKEKWDRLLGRSKGVAGRNPPWIECCIVSYYTDKANPWQTRLYRIFATRLL